MKRVAMILAVLTGGCALTDTREHGFEAGRKAVRNVRDANGPMGEGLVRMAEMSPNPPNPKKSAEWNGGFGAGVREELDHDSRPDPWR